MPTILLIDEEAYLLRHFLPVAETAGYKVQGTANVEEGIRLARRLKPDVILLNTLPPDGTGALFCKEVKTDPVFAGTSLLLFSNEQPSDDGQSHALPDADEYAPKPISNRDLLARIHLLLRLKKAEQQVVQAHLDIRHKQHTLQMMQQEVHSLRQQQRQIAPPPPLKEAKPAVPEQTTFNLALPVGGCRLNKFSIIMETNPLAAEYLNLSGATGVDTLFADYMVEEDVTPFFEHLTAVFETSLRQTCEFRIRPSKGRSRYLLAESAIIPKADETSDECIMLLTDISTYKRSQPRIEPQRPAIVPQPTPMIPAVAAFPVQAILEAVEQGITITDASGQIILMNAQMEKLTGYRKDEATDREALLKLLYPHVEHYQRALSSVQATLLNGRILNVATLIRMKDGTLKSLTVSLYRVQVQHEDWVLSAYRERSMTTLLKPDLSHRRKVRPTKMAPLVAQFPRRQETPINQPEPTIIQEKPAHHIARKTRRAEPVRQSEQRAKPVEPVRQSEPKARPGEPVRQIERKVRPPEPVRQFGRKTRKERKNKIVCAS